MNKMKITNILNDKLNVIESKFGQQVWSIGRVTLKKQLSKRCCECGGGLGDTASRPITNGYNRGDRLCNFCLALLIKEFIETNKGMKDDERVKC